MHKTVGQLEGVPPEWGMSETEQMYWKAYHRVLAEEHA